MEGQPRLMTQKVAGLDSPPSGMSTYSLVNGSLSGRIGSHLAKALLRRTALHVAEWPIGGPPMRRGGAPTAAAVLVVSPDVRCRFRRRYRLSGVHRCAGPPAIAFGQHRPSAAAL